jgi:rhodanese-related sulfurtransferase
VAEDVMAERVDALEAKQLIADGITVLDALPEQTWRQERLPGARSMPLATFDPSKVEDVKRDEPLLVYCFDQHCDPAPACAADSTSSASSGCTI